MVLGGISEKRSVGAIEIVPVGAHHSVLIFICRVIGAG